jgi:adhesin/invasin
MISAMKHKEKPLPTIFAPLRKFFTRLVPVFLLTALGVVFHSFEAAAQPYNVTIIPIANHQVADGISQDEIQILVTNQSDGLPAPNVDVYFTIQGTTVSSRLTTNAGGLVDYGLSSTSTVNTNIIISINGNPVAGSPVTFYYIAGSPSTSNPSTALLVNVPTAPADGVTATVIHAHVVDPLGNPVPGATVVFSTAGGTAAGSAVVSYQSATTDGSGNETILITNVNSGTVFFTATVNGVPITNGSPALVTFIAINPSVTNPATQLIVDVPTAPADGSTDAVIHAHIVDASGNPVQNATVVFTVSGGSAAGTAVVTYVSAKTDANGDETIDITNLKSGTVSFTATVNGTSIIYGSPATVTFTATAPSVSNPATQLIVDVPVSPPDGTTADVIHAHIVDVNGNPVPNATVVFTISGGTAAGTAVVTYVSGTTDGNGDETIDITNLKAGTVTFTATVNGTPIVNGSPATVSFVATTPSVTNPLTMLVVDVTNSPADGTTDDVIHAHIVDANGNPVANATVVYTISGGTASGSANVTYLTTVTDGNGDETIDITNTTAGTVSFTATVNGIPIINGSPAIATFVAGAPSVTNPATQLIVDVTGAAADGSSINTIHAHIVDVNGNPVPNATVVFTISGGTAAGGAVFTTVTATTDANGNETINITDNIAGTVSFTATVNGLQITNGSPATVNFVSGQPVPGDPGGGGPGGTPPGNGGNPPGGSGNNNGPGSNSGFTVLFIDQDNRLADGNQQDSIIAYITDINKNPVAGVAVTFFIQTSPTAGTIASGAQFVGSPVNVITDASGMARIAMTSTTPGTVFVDATIVDPATGNTVLIDGSYQVAHFLDQPDVNNPLTTLSVVIYEALADGTQQTEVKAHIVDLSGDVMPGQNVTFAIDSGSGTIVTPQPVVTDANGDAYIYITSTTVGDVLITATVGSTPIINGSPARVAFAGINIYVPKVFTPNGDGTNDILKPILVGISTFHYFSVYNRWGNLIFTTQDPNQGWDGTFKGVPQPVETYLWIGEGIDTNGKKIVRKGMVSLVR